MTRRLLSRWLAGGAIALVSSISLPASAQAPDES
jgi:hypothetical protein